MGWLEGITDSVDMNLSKLWEMAKDREAWSAVTHGVAELDMTEHIHIYTQELENMRILYNSS